MHFRTSSPYVRKPINLQNELTSCIKYFMTQGLLFISTLSASLCPATCSSGGDVQYRHIRNMPLTRWDTSHCLLWSLNVIFIIVFQVRIEQSLSTPCLPPGSVKASSIISSNHHCVSMAALFMTPRFRYRNSFGP